MNQLKTLNFENNDDLETYLEESYFDLQLTTYPNLFEAFVGVIEGKGLEPKVCYDYNKSITLLAEQMADQGELNDKNMEAAIEHFEFNTLGAYYGEHTPVFLYRNLEEL